MQLQSLTDVGRPYGAKGYEVAAIAESEGYDPIAINCRTRVLLPEQVEAIRPKLERLREIRGSRPAPQVAQV